MGVLDSSALQMLLWWWLLKNWLLWATVPFLYPWVVSWIPSPGIERNLLQKVLQEMFCRKSFAENVLQKMFCKNVLQKMFCRKSFAKMYWHNVLQKSFAGKPSHKCFAKMFCKKFCRKCFAKMFCKNVLQKMFCIMFCKKVLQESLHINVLQKVLQNVLQKKFCIMFCRKAFAKMFCKKFCKMFCKDFSPTKEFSWDGLFLFPIFKRVLLFSNTKLKNTSSLLVLHYQYPQQCGDRSHQVDDQEYLWPRPENAKGCSLCWNRGINNCSANFQTFHNFCYYRHNNE